MAHKDKDKEKDDEKNGKDTPIPPLPKALPVVPVVPRVPRDMKEFRKKWFGAPEPLGPRLPEADPAVPIVPQAIPDAPVPGKPVEEGLGVLTKEAVKEIKDKKRRRKAEEALVAKDLADKTAKKAADKLREVRMDAALADARAQKEIEKKLMKEAGAPGGLEKLLTYATGGIFGAVSGAYSRHGRGVQDVENFRAALKQQRALTGAKTSKTVASLSATGQSDPANAVNLLGFLRENKFIGGDGNIETTDGKGPWWSGLGFDENSTPAMVDARINRHIKRLSRGPTRTDKLGNKVHDPSSAIFLKGVVQRLQLHKDNYLTEQRWDHEAAKGMDAKKDEYYLALGANSPVGPALDDPNYFNKDKSKTGNFYLYEKGRLVEDTKLNATVREQVMKKGPAAAGEYERLMHNFGQYDFDGNSWFKEQNDMGKMYVTTDAFLQRLELVNKAVEQNITLFGREESVVSMDENPFESIMSIQRSIAGVRLLLKEENAPEVAKGLQKALKKLEVDYRKANAASKQLLAKVVNDNRKFLAVETDDADSKKLRDERLVEAHRKKTQDFKRLIVPADDEGDFIMKEGEFKGKTLYEAMYWDKEDNLKDMFLSFLNTDYRTIPGIIDSAQRMKNPAAAIKLIMGDSGSRARLYAPKGPFDVDDPKMRELPTTFNKRNYRYITEQQRAEMNRVRLAYRKAGAELDFTPELISPDIQTVFNSPEQTKAIGERIGRANLKAIAGALSTEGQLERARKVLFAEDEKKQTGQPFNTRDVKKAVAIFLRAFGVHEYEEMTDEEIEKIR